MNTFITFKLWVGSGFAFLNQRGLGKLIMLFTRLQLMRYTFLKKSLYNLTKIAYNCSLFKRLIHEF